jgi:L-aminopeptidase/D-esterase-like protein
MIGPGPRNLITDVDGILVGNAEDFSARTGVTVVFPVEPAVAAVDVRGGAPGTRETDLLDPACLVERVDAICLSGGSAFGLDAASGVMAHLVSIGRGFPVRGFRVPIVPAAILFDLANGGDKEWGEEPPYRALGRRAAAACGHDFRLGNSGAGMGAVAGALKGGLGSASAAAGAYTVGALIAANCVGSVTLPGQAAFWAGPLQQGGEFGGPRPVLPAPLDLDLPPDTKLAGHTAIGVVATDAALTKAEARRVAIMAHDGLARAVRPSHTPFDGDTVFVVATGRRPLPEPRARELARLGSLAADCLARAVARAVYAAESLGAARSWRDTYP